MAENLTGVLSTHATKSSQVTHKTCDRHEIGIVEYDSSAGMRVDENLEVSELVVDLGCFPAATQPKNALYITGIGSQYPPFTVKPEQFEKMIRKNYDAELPSIEKLLQINQTTMIESRSSTKAYEDPFWSRSIPPGISELDQMFRKTGVDLSVQASKKALRDARLQTNDITHIVAVTCTNAGNPGFDLLVAQRLGLKPEVDRTLLHGVGCAGGLSAMRAAAAMAQSYTMRKRVARVLVFACEICSVNMQSDMEDMLENSEGTKITPALFSDGAASFVLCNDLEDDAQGRGVYELVNWETSTVPNTAGELEFMIDPLGFRTTLTKDVPNIALAAIRPMFERLLNSVPETSVLSQSGKKAQAKHFDWALHPGGIAILNGAQHQLELHEGQLRASFDVYKNHGNSSSPTVLIILDTLRRMEREKEHVIACSFGPGMVVEMAMLRRMNRHNIK